MSHIVRVSKLLIADLDALEKGLPAIGLRLLRGVTDCRAHESHGIKCAHVIERIDDTGNGYQVALTDAGDGKFAVSFDDWGKHGAHLKQAVGPDAGLLRQAYASEVIKKQMFREGYRLQQTVDASGVRHLTAVKS